jgi:hypothetical protein
VAAPKPTPKRHHYVPRRLLRNFADAEGWLHWTAVRGAEDVRRARPDTLFHAKHLYSTIDANGVKDPAVEDILQKLENRARPIMSRIIEAARADRLPALTEIECRIWYNYFATQWRRTPETRDAVASTESVAAMLDDIIAKAKRRFPHRHAEIDALYTPELHARTVRNAWATTLPQEGGEVERVLAARGLLILRITAPNKAFVIGSRPVVKLTPQGRTDLRDHVCEMWLPIASDVAVGAGRGAMELLYLDRAKPIRQLNLAIAQQSGVIAAHVPELVRSLAHDR